jgi:hydroxyacylglutathione hydrolase
MDSANQSSIKTNEIFKSIYSFYINKSVYSYLVIGKEKAVLIDTGWGTVDLKEAVSSLTSLPLLVVNTHGHIDHIYGNYQFDNIFIRDEDLVMLQYDFNRERRWNILKQHGSNLLPEGYTEELWAEAKINKISSLNDIKCISLGDRDIEVISTPGHTAGSVCLFDKESGVLFSGDNIWEGDIMLHFNLSTKLAVYLESLKQLLIYSPDISCILPSHGKTPIDNSIIKKLIVAVENIINKKLSGEKHTVFNRSCLKCEFDEFNILYREDSI